MTFTSIKRFNKPRHSTSIRVAAHEIAPPKTQFFLQLSLFQLASLCLLHTSYNEECSNRGPASTSTTLTFRNACRTCTIASPLPTRKAFSSHLNYPNTYRVLLPLCIIACKYPPRNEFHHTLGVSRSSHFWMLSYDSDPKLSRLLHLSIVSGHRQFSKYSSFEGKSPGDRMISER